MFDLGFAELVTFGMIALVVLGPEKLPRAMRTLGRYYAKFRRTISTIQAEMESELDLAETRQQMQQELAKIKQAELDMQQQMAKMRQNMRKFEQHQDHLLTSGNDDNTAGITPQDNVQNSKHQGMDNDNIGDTTANNLKLVAQEDIENKLFDARLTNTRPWESMWFRLGAYDKARRLPAPPRLPNYSADKLLNTSVPLTSQTTNKKVL